MTSLWPVYTSFRTGLLLILSLWISYHTLSLWTILPLVIFTSKHGRETGWLKISAIVLAPQETAGPYRPIKCIHSVTIGVFQLVSSIAWLWHMMNGDLSESYAFLALSVGFLLCQMIIIELKKNSLTNAHGCLKALSDTLLKANSKCCMHVG